MVDINSTREKNISNFVDLIIQKGAYINNKILLREISNNNMGFISLGEIEPTKKIISIPNKLLISRENLKKFLQNEELNSYDEKLISLYFSILPNYAFFKEKNFFFLNQEDYKKCLSFFKNNSPIKKSIENQFEKFNKKENDIDKYIFLLFRTRSFRVNKQSYLAPLLDFMNFNFSTRGYFLDSRNIYFNSEKKLKKNEEIFHSYNLQIDPIKFFISYSFFPSNYSKLTFSENQFTLNVSKNAISNIDNKYWNINNNQVISNKNPISFYDHKVPLIINLMFESLFTDKNLKFNAIYNFLTLVKNQFDLNEINLFLESNNNNLILVEFVKSINLYISNLDKILETMQS
jgi:hypothetical protein